METRLLKPWERDYITDRPVSKKLYSDSIRIWDVLDTGEVYVWVVTGKAEEKEWLVSPTKIGPQEIKVIWE